VKLLLIDGHYYVYRSFFAIRELSNSRGEPTNAIYGFVKTVRRMVKDLAPDLGAVIWDEGLPKRRTDLQPAYKETRAEMPDLMRPQLACIQKLVPLMGFASLSLPDTEADDLMASYTCAARRNGYDVVLATNDKDLFQLVDEKVKVYTTNKAELASPKDAFALLGQESVQRKWGVDPERIADVLSLGGDSVDNIPGVDGLGPKGAALLLQEHGSLDAILANPERVKGERIREKLKGARERIEQNREMVRLEKDLPLPIELDALTIRPKYPEFVAALAECEFKSLLAEVQQEARLAVHSQGELF
jgi:5'-3' exonuclease